MKIARQILTLLIIVIILPSCALIVGGSNYNAMVNVEGGTNPTIYYKGKKVGIGSAVIKIPRKDADRVVFAVKEDDCEEQQFAFTSKRFRAAAAVFSFLGFSILTPSGIPIPVGNAIDLAFGAYWKPNDKEIGIRKLDYKNFKYELEYNMCSYEEEIEMEQSIKQKLKTLDDLFDAGKISEEEYKAARKKALEL